MNKMVWLKDATLAAVATVFVSLSGTAMSTEGGTSVYPFGVENFYNGAVPPPGVYGLVYAHTYRADKLRDNNGYDVTPPGFEINANVIAPRLVWAPGASFLGGELVAHAFLPLVDLEVKVAGLRQSKAGIGDIAAGIGVGWHHSAQLHSLVALDVFLPTGSYNPNAVANIGKNHFAWEPVVAVSYIDQEGFNADFKFGYLVNARNRDTGYKSGHEFHVDYALGWAVSQKWTIGAGGYFLSQVTDDRINGRHIRDSRARSFAIGPTVKYDSGSGWFITAKLQRETSVRNRAEGDGFWLKAVVPF